jgi:integrase
MSATLRTRTLKDGTKVQDKTWTIVFRHPATRKQTWLQTDCESKTAALGVERDILRELKAGRIPALLASLQQRHAQSVRQLIEAYAGARCPDRNKEPRSGDSLDAETRNCDTLRRWTGWHKPADQITDADQDDYHTWRLGTVAKGKGHRTTELELNTLRNALAWAVRTRAIERSPLTRVYRFRRARDIEHARDFMPRSADELHTLAGAMLVDRRTEARGWQVLLQALTGIREGEARELLAAPARPDPISPPPPGYCDERYLYVKRLKRGRNPRVRLDDPERPHIRSLLDHIRCWKSLRYPASAWLLPSSTGEQLGDSSLSKILKGICQDLQLPARHGHGLRAYYATCRLAAGVDPEDIARELGQSSGDELIRSVYGADRDDFDVDQWRALAGQFTWLPATVRPAWEVWAEATAKAGQATNLVPLAV